MGRIRSTRTWLLLAAGLLAACDDPVDTDDGPTFVRFVNVAPDADGPLRFAMQGGAGAVLQRGESSMYMAAEPRAYDVTIQDNSNHWLIADDLELIGGLYQTLIAFGEASSAGGVLVGDEPGLPPGGQFLLRVLHLAPQTPGQIAIHIAARNEALSDTTRAIPQLSYPASRGHAPIEEGEWRVVVTNATTDSVLADSGVLSFPGGQSFTVIVLNGANGAAQILRLRDGT